jgi:hypothetical protein
MVLDYAKTPSDATVQRESGGDELEAHKRRRLAEKGTLDRHWRSICKDSVHANDDCLQSVSKPTRPSKHRRSSSVLLPPPNPHAQPRPPKVPVSSPPLLPPLPSFRTSTYHPTRFCSCGNCRTTQPRKACLLSLAGSRDSRKSDWYPVARELHSSNTRPRLEQSARRRLRRACPWATRARRFALPTSDSSREWFVASYKISRSRSFWRLEGLVSSTCVLEIWRVLPLSSCCRNASRLRITSSSIFPK